MFTHIPAQCNIKIFTLNRILVDEIEVDNAVLTNEWYSSIESTGIVHWDLLSKEGLEISAGWYVYIVKSNITQYKKMGKFAIIK